MPKSVREKTIKDSFPKTTNPPAPKLTPFTITGKYRLCPNLNCDTPLKRRWVEDPNSPLLSRNKKRLLDHINQNFNHYSDCTQREIEAKYKITKCRCGLFFSILKNGGSKSHNCKFNIPALTLETSKIQKRRINNCNSVKTLAFRKFYNTSQSSFSRQNRGKVFEKKFVAETNPKCASSLYHFPVKNKSPGSRLTFSWPSVYANVSS